MASNNPWDGSGGPSGGLSNPWSGASGASSGGVGGSGNPWDGSGGVVTPSADTPKPKGSGGWLSTALHGVGDVAGAIKGVATGTAGLAADLTRYPGVLVSAASKGKLMDQDYIDAQLAKKQPHLAGYLGVGGPGQGSGWTQTLRDVGAKGLLSKAQQADTVSPGKAYGSNPLMAALNDAGNVATVTGPIAGVAGEAAEGAEAGSVAARVAQATKAVDVAANPISWPFKGGRALLTAQGEKGLATAVAAEEASKAGVDVAALAKPTALQKLGARFLPEAAKASDIAVTRADKLDAIKNVVGMDAEKADAVLRKAGMADVADSIKQAHEGNLFNAQGQPTESALPGQAPAAAPTRTATPTPAAGSFTERQPNFVQGSLTPPAAETIKPLPAAEAASAAAGAKTILPEHAAEAIKSVQAGAAAQIAALPHGDTLAKLLGLNNTQRIDNALVNVLATADPVNRALYISKLGLDPSILVGRAGGHTALALGATHPLGVFKNIGRQVLGKVKPSEYEGMSPRIPKNAIVAEKALQDADVAGKTNLFAKAARTIGNLQDNKVTGFLPKVAGKMDDVIRKAAYLSERQGGADAETAARNVLKQFGEFDNLSPLERDVMRRIVPFYNWHKQIALIASHLAEDHPLRAELMIKAGDVSNQINQQQGLPEGEIKIGGHLVDPGFVMPFGEAGTTTKALGFPMFSPVAKAGIGLGLHINPNTGKPFSGPLAKAGVDYAAPGVLQNLRKTFPQINLADALSGRGDVVRYNDGSPVVVGGKTIPTGSDGVDALLSFAGLRSENAASGEQRTASLKASKAKDATRAQKADAKYQASLRSGG